LWTRRFLTMTNSACTAVTRLCCWRVVACGVLTGTMKQVKGDVAEALVL